MTWFLKCNINFYIRIELNYDCINTGEASNVTELNTQQNRYLVNDDIFPSKKQLQQNNDNPSHYQWTTQCDIELMDWATEIPSDWQVGGKCSAYLFGNGIHGELANTQLVKSAKPSLVQSFEVAHQIECGVDCTFVIHANGSNVSSCGNGTSGRLGNPEGSNDN